MYDYQDHNRYSAGRGAHINLKRAERARITVTKIPGILFLFYLLGHILPKHADSLDLTN